MLTRLFIVLSRLPLYLGVQAPSRTQSSRPGARQEEPVMKPQEIRRIATVAALAGMLGVGALSAQDKYALKVPGGLAFSEFKGFEHWEVIAVSHNGDALAAIVGNPAMIAAYQAGAPGNGKPFPDGAKMAKIHWTPKKHEIFPTALVPAMQHDVDFMVKDSKRFADSGGWGYAVFERDPATGLFRPGNTTDTPPQANDAKCGFACHTVVKNRDFVFTDYAPR
jgi:hypothetical protein